MLSGGHTSSLWPRDRYFQSSPLAQPRRLTLPCALPPSPGEAEQPGPRWGEPDSAGQPSLSSSTHLSAGGCATWGGQAFSQRRGGARDLGVCFTSIPLIPALSAPCSLPLSRTTWPGPTHNLENNRSGGGGAEDSVTWFDVVLSNTNTSTQIDYKSVERTSRGRQ